MGLEGESKARDVAGATSGIDLTMVQDIKEIETHEAAIVTKRDVLAGKIPFGRAVMMSRKDNAVAISEGGKLRVLALIVLDELPGSGA